MQNDKDAMALMSFIDTHAYESTVGKWIEAMKIHSMRAAATTQSEIDMYRAQGSFQILDELQLQIKDVIDTHLKLQTKKVNKLIKENQNDRGE